MLQHADPAIVAVLRIRGLALVDIAESNLLKFFLVGVDRRTGVGRHHRRITIGQFGIAHQLEIGKGFERRCSRIGQLVLDVDYIVVALELVGLRRFHAAGRFETDLEGGSTIGHFVFLGRGGVFSLMIGQAGADQS